MTKLISTTFAAMLLLAGLSFGQTVTTSTTLSSAMSRGDQTLNLTSSTGVSGLGQANVVITGLYIDREYITVVANANAVGTGNQWTVKRGVNGIQTAHANAAMVWVGPPSVFDLGANDRVGSCTASSFAFLPLIMVKSGNLMGCNGSYVRFGAYGDTSIAGTVIASATTVAPLSRVTHISGTAAITTITVPPALPDGGTFTFIPDGAFTYTNAVNIGAASGTAIVGKPMVFTYDKTTGKVYPSY